MARTKSKSLGELDQIQLESEKLECWYSELQTDFALTHREELASLVSGVSNRLLPIHRWFNLKEAFSAQLPIWIINYLKEHYGAQIAQVVDPFVGGGTTGVALAPEGISVDGIEYNPFIHFVASTKSYFPKMNRAVITEAISQIVLAEPSKTLNLPDLSTLIQPDFFSFRDLQVMLHVIEQINCEIMDRASQSFLLLGVAAAIDDVANLRKDGRALRYSPKVSRPAAEKAIASRWKDMLQDLSSIQYKAPFRVFSGTAVDLTDSLPGSSFDLALYSPPYLNNFDYSEIYKLELWLLGFLKNNEDWRLLRKSTIRSHPSVAFEETSYLHQNPKMFEIVQQVTAMENSICLVDERTQKEMRGVITGYFDDMYQALWHQWQALKPGGFLVYIVANSRHKFLPIATDVILASIAKQIGFEPLEIVVFKQRNGRTRQKAYLRETATFMRKPLES